MEKIEKIKVKDRTKIRKVVFKEPELMAEDAEETIRSKYDRLQVLEKELYEARLKVLELEELCEECKKFFRNSGFFELEFEEEERQHVVHNDTIAIKGMGNDLIGRMS